MIPARHRINRRATHKSKPMKTTLQKALAKIAPSISIRTIWEHDHDLIDIRQDCDGMDDADPDDWQAWRSEVQATAFDNGEEVTTSTHLGGTWEKAGDLPEYSNPAISGYENQMTWEALEELATLVTGATLKNEVRSAMDHCKRLSHAEYEAQQLANV